LYLWIVDSNPCCINNQVVIVLLVQLVRLTSLALVVVDYLGVSVLISVVIDCVVVLLSGLAPLQCTTPDLTKLAKQFLSDPSQSNNSQATIIVITLHYLTIKIVKVQGVGLHNLIHWILLYKSGLSINTTPLQ
jgi:hypothetical protein